MLLEKTEVLSWESLADSLEAAFGLTIPPVAITFTADRPAAVAEFDAPMPPPLPDGRTGRVSAGCVFWMEGAEHTFSTVADDHGNCSVGLLTHGFATVDDIVDNDDVQTLLGSGWVEARAVVDIPVITERPGAVTYGPLRDTPIDPDVIFLRLNGAGVMLLTDAISGLSISDKPQCGIVATAKDRGEVALSAGCALSRARTGMSDEDITCAIPASIATDLVGKVLAAKAINNQVVDYALDDARRFGA